MGSTDTSAVARAIFEEGWNREDFARVADALSDFRFHIGGAERPMDLQELRAIVRSWHVGFPDLRFDLHAVVASDDHAAVHATLHGTHHGRWRDLEPTGRTIEVEHMFVFRFEDDAVADVWELLDERALAAQLTG